LSRKASSKRAAKALVVTKRKTSSSLRIRGL
jgi:hypothetical protein